MNKNEFRLCGGVFFLLFTKALKPISSGNKTMVDLIKVLYPNYHDLSSSKNSYQKTLSEYKSCKKNGGCYIPFNNTEVRETAKNSIEKDYPSALSRMSKVISEFIDLSSKKHILLIKELIEMIKVDDSIDDNQAFYVLAGGQTLTKSQIIQSESICLEAFLLGVWYYSVIQENKNGLDTYNYLCPPSNNPEEKNNKREYIGSLGRNSQPIEITSTLFSDDSITEVQNDSKVVSNPLSIGDKNLLLKFKEDFTPVIKDLIQFELCDVPINSTIIQRINELYDCWRFADTTFQNKELNSLKTSIIDNLNTLNSFFSCKYLLPLENQNFLFLVKGYDVQTLELRDQFINGVSKIQNELSKLFKELYLYN